MEAKDVERAGERSNEREAIADPLVRLNNETIANQLQPFGREQKSSRRV